MDLEMLPCPFCGEAARHNTYQDESLWSHNIVDWHTVGCPSCEIEMRQCEGFDDILAAWNTRPRVAELESDRDNLLCALQEIADTAEPTHRAGRIARDVLNLKR